MSFIAGTGKTNVDILYAGLKRLPQLGEELYSDGFKLCLGGGVRYNGESRQTEHSG